jgi:hypothetical protein
MRRPRSAFGPEADLDKLPTIRVQKSNPAAFHVALNVRT